MRNMILQVQQIPTSFEVHVWALDDMWVENRFICSGK